MGLDQYAYVAANAGDYDLFWRTADHDSTTGVFTSKAVAKPRELAYWRKHSSLHGAMRKLWLLKGNDGAFNGDELELDWDDLEILETLIKRGELPATSGFFFGDDSSEYYKAQDLQFIADARAELFCGLKVFYNSSW